MGPTSRGADRASPVDTAARFANIRSAKSRALSLHRPAVHAHVRHRAGREEIFWPQTSARRGAKGLFRPGHESQARRSGCPVKPKANERTFPTQAKAGGRRAGAWTDGVLPMPILRRPRLWPNGGLSVGGGASESRGVGWLKAGARRARLEGESRPL